MTIPKPLKKPHILNKLKDKPMGFFKNFGLTSDEVITLKRHEEKAYKNTRFNLSSENLKESVFLRKKNLEKLKNYLLNLEKNTNNSIRQPILEQLFDHIENEKEALNKLIEFKGQDKVFAFLTSINIRDGKIKILLGKL